MADEAVGRAEATFYASALTYITLSRAAGGRAEMGAQREMRCRRMHDKKHTHTMQREQINDQIDEKSATKWRLRPQWDSGSAAQWDAGSRKERTIKQGRTMCSV